MSAPYIREGLVSLIHWPIGFLWVRTEIPPTALSTQLPAYENAAKYMGITDTQWLAFIHVEEYLVSVNGDMVSEVLQRYNDSPGVQLVSDCFDASDFNALPKRAPDRHIDLTASPQENIQKSVQKISLNPNATTFTWPLQMRFHRT